MRSASWHRVFVFVEHLCCNFFNCGHVAGVQVDDSVLPADVVVIAMGPWSSAAAKWVPGFPHVEGDKVRAVVRAYICS